MNPGKFVHKPAKKHAGIFTAAKDSLKILSIYLVVFCIIFSIFKPSTTLHWFPLFTSAILFIFLFSNKIILYIDYTEPVFLTQTQYHQSRYFLDPEGLTKNEIQDLLDGRITPAYRKIGKIKILFVYFILLLLILIACAITKYALNVLITYPLIFLHFRYKPAVNWYIHNTVGLKGTKWEYCPRCQAVAVRWDSSKSTSVKTWTTSEPTTESIKITDGVDTVGWIERHTSTTVAHKLETTTQINYFCCLKCNNKFTNTEISTWGG